MKKVINIFMAIAIFISINIRTVSAHSNETAISTSVSVASIFDVKEGVVVYKESNGILFKIEKRNDTIYVYDSNTDVLLMFMGDSATNDNFSQRAINYKKNDARNLLNGNMQWTPYGFWKSEYVTITNGAGDASIIAGLIGLIPGIGSGVALVAWAAGLALNYLSQFGQIKLKAMMYTRTNIPCWAYAEVKSELYNNSNNDYYGQSISYRWNQNQWDDALPYECRLIN